MNIPSTDNRRGCRARCSFCGVRNFNGKSVRVRDNKGVVDEMVKLRTEHGVRHFDWLDDDLLYDRDGIVELFDMIADPGQKQDLSQQRPDEARRLSQAVIDWRQTVLSEMKRVVHPFTVGYREFPVTLLPARDGVASGKIRRSAKAPNCSYFTNWISIDR